MPLRKALQRHLPNLLQYSATQRDHVLWSKLELIVSVFIMYVLDPRVRLYLPVKGVKTGRALLINISRYLLLVSKSAKKKTLAYIFAVFLNLRWIVTVFALVFRCIDNTTVSIEFPITREQINFALV